MSKVNATFGGFVGHEGVPVLLAVGDEYEADHPLVMARPELFTKPPEPKQPKQAETKRDPEPKPPADPTPPPAPPEAPAPPKRGPGRPAGSKAKPKIANG